jgi:cysteinyl-tRNA synthetase
MAKDLVLFNTLGRRLERFVPVVPGEARVYTCGPTVYNDPHIGNLRTFVVQDVLRRTLSYFGYRVTQVMNLTDVDDKTILGAQRAGISLNDYTEPFIRSFLADLDALHIQRVERFPRATEHVPEMIAIIERLLARGYAYVSDGSVWFSIAKDVDYGRLSGFDLEQVRRGERVASDEYGKGDVRDFVLWKGAKPGEPAWDSPWGPGRPGWHVECSAMATKYLGDGFDIHGGGTDLIFPHHENEIAQSEGASGETFSRYWLHNGMVNLGGEKMAKSTGLLVDLASIAEKHGGRALRLLFLRAHYRSPIEYSDELLAEAEDALDRLQRFRDRATPGDPDPASLDRFREVMDEDFATPEAMSLLFDLVRDGNRALDEGRDASALAGAVEEIVEVLGLDDAALPAETSLDLGDLPSRFGLEGEGAEVIDRLIDLRAKAREERRFEDADAIRLGLEEAGVVLEDGPDGTRWLRK